MTQTQAQALLFGAALGDALGSPVTMQTRDEIVAQHGSQGVESPPNPALYSDKSQLMLALATALLDAGLDATLDAQMVSIGDAFVRWMYTAPTRTPSSTTVAAMRRFEAGERWPTSGLDNSQGNNSVCRVLAVGYCFQGRPDRLVRVARASSLITHRHPTVVAATIAAAHVVGLALNGVSPSDYLAAALAVTDGASEAFDAAIYRAGQAHFASVEKCMRHIGSGWTAHEALALALWCVTRYPDDYVAAVRAAANFDGCSGAVACLTGGISAAWLGLDAIPAGWLAYCENREMLLDCSERMFSSQRGFLTHE